MYCRDFDTELSKKEKKFLALLTIPSTESGQSESSSRVRRFEGWSRVDIAKTTVISKMRNMKKLRVAKEK